jgi:hypothetical protein
MGFSISWIAVHGLSKSEVCQRLAIFDTGEPDEANESPISGASLPNDWQVIFLNDLLHPFVAVESLNRLSKGCEVVGCQVEEHVMVCAAFFYANGARVWNITHESDKGLTNLDSEGLLPAAFEEIKARNLAAQQKDDNEDGGVDYIFEVPLELAEHICGYKHDRWQFEWGEPTFTKFVPAAP